MFHPYLYHRLSGTLVKHGNHCVSGCEALRGKITYFCHMRDTTVNLKPHFMLLIYLMHMFGYGILMGGHWGDDYACLSSNELAYV